MNVNNEKGFRCFYEPLKNKIISKWKKIEWSITPIPKLSWGSLAWPRGFLGGIEMFIALLTP
jgi:hypothetical protein